MRPLVRLLCAMLSLSLLAGCGGGGGGGSPSPSVASGSSGGYGGGSGGGGGGGNPGGGPTASPASGPAPRVPAAGTIYLGAFVNPKGAEGNDGNYASTISGFEGQIGRNLALSLHYSGWESQFPGSEEAADGAAGRIPIISWGCNTTDARIAAGFEDANITAHADALRAYGKPVFLRYKWEMNLQVIANGRADCANAAHDTPDGFFSPADFIAAWNHIHAIFVARGANNVAFLWNPSGGSPTGPAAYYPGGASVDWVGIDEYDRNDETFQDTYNMYAQVVGYGKPILIAETGANPEYQPTFFGAAVATLQNNFPKVKGFVYFDSPGNFSWTLTPAGTTAFAAMSRSPYLSAP